MHRERARGSVFEESFLNSGKAGTGEIHASRAASVMDFVGGSRSAATGDALQPVGCFGARNPCADCPPPAALLARPAIRGFPAAIAAGRGQAAAAPLSAPHKGRVERPLPLCYPHLCLARSYQAHAGVFCGKPLSCACPGDWVHGIGAARPCPMRRAEGRSRGLSAPGGYSRRKAPNSRPGKRSVRR